MRKSAMVVLAAGLLVAGCGDDDAGDAAGGPTGTWPWQAEVASETTTTTAAPTTTSPPTTTTTEASEPAEVGPVTVEGESLPLLPATGDSEAVGLPAPTVSGDGIDGGSVAIGPYDGPTVVLFLTHWCPACQTTVSEVSPWWNSGAAPGDVDMVAVSTGVDPGAANHPPSAWLDREEWAIPTLVDDEESSTGAAFGLTAYPFWVVIDEDGTVVDQVVGSLDPTEIEALFDRARTP